MVGTWIAAAPRSIAARAMSAVSTPFRTSGRSVVRWMKATSSRLRLLLNTAVPLFTRGRHWGKEKPSRATRSEAPGAKASIVNTIAEQPAAAARCSSSRDRPGSSMR